MGKWAEDRAVGNAKRCPRPAIRFERMLADHPELAGYEAYACGSVKIVEAAVPAFVAQGLGEASCFSDALYLSNERF